MYYDDDGSGALTFVAGMLLGAAVGASLALLTAPQSGRKTRKRLVRAVSTARDSAGDHWEDLADEVQGAVRAGRKRIRL
jgi:gas vesicle protein